MTVLEPNISHHDHQLTSIVNYLDAVAKELEVDIADDKKVVIANELLMAPYDLSGAITKYQPDINLDEQGFNLGVIPRPRLMQIPLKTQDKNDNHISYFSFSSPPNVDDVELYYNKQRNKELETLKTLRLQQFLQKHVPIDLTRTEITAEDTLWENTFEHGHSDLHSGVARLLGSSTQPNENCSAKVKSNLLNQITPLKGKRSPYSLWLKLSKPEYLLPFQNQYEFGSRHELFVNLHIHSVFNYSIESGVDVITIGIEYCSIDVVEMLPNDGYACIANLPITVEDVREINYQLAHIYQFKYANQLCFVETQTLSTMPSNVSELPKKQLDNIRQKRDGYLQKIGVNSGTRDTTQWLSVTKSIGSNFSLLMLLETLIPKSMFGGEVVTRRRSLSRPLIYSQMQIEDRPEIQKKNELEHYFNRLRSQIAAVINCNYIASSHTRIASFGDVDICSTVTRQGGCTIINNLHRDRKHNDQFISNSGKVVYLGIMITAYIQYTFLNSIDQQYVFPLTSLNTPEALEKHAKLKNYLIHFRVNYTFTDISKLDIHNQAFEAWHNVFSLDALTQQLDQDVNDTSTLLNTIYQQQELSHNRSLRHLATFGTVVIFLTGVFGMNFHEFSVDPPRLFSLDWHLIVIALVAIGTLLYSESLTIRQSIVPRITNKLRRWLKR